jgi:hypothetical protein
VKNIFAAIIAVFSMANVLAAQTPKATVSLLDALTLTKEHNYMCWPSGDNSINRRLQVVMNFKAEETAAEAEQGGYADHYCDFYLTFSGLKEGAVTADGCYLAGNYGTFGWIVIPTDGLRVENDVEYPVVSAYDAKLTYRDICSSVKDFTAAIYITPEILAANPDFKVTLKLKMKNPETEEFLTIGEPATYDCATLKKAFLPTATVTPVENEDLTFALNFKTDAVSDAQMNVFGKWYADFVLTVNKDVTFNANGGADGHLSGQYDAWSENWVNVPFENVTLKAGESLKIMEYAAEMMNQDGLKLTYNDICSFVKDFDCGVFFEPAFLALNPDFKVTLELRMYNNENEAESYVIGKPYEFVSPANSDIVMRPPMVDTSAMTAAQKDAVKEFGANIAVVAVENTGIAAGANANKVAAAKAELKKLGVSEADAAAAAPVVAITLSAVEFGEGASLPSKMTFDVAPALSVGDKSVEMNSFSAPVTFRLPVSSDETKAFAKICHEGEFLAIAPIRTELGFKFVEVSSKTFSLYSVEPTDGVSTLDELKAALASEDMAQIKLNETIVIPEGEIVELDLNGKTISGADGVKISNFGELTIKDSVGALTGMVMVVLENSGTAFLTDGMFMAGVINAETAQMQITGGGYPVEVTRGWIPAGYACSKVSKDGLSGYVVAKLPTATVSSISATELDAKNAPKDITYTLKFKADSFTQVQMLCFTNWYADFEFTISSDATFNYSDLASDGYLSGQYDSWSKSWVSVPTTNVALTANKPLRIMEYGAELLKEKGLKMTYGEVATRVKEFSCGVALRPDFIAANPGLTVKLSLKMYNPADETEFYVIGSEYVFTVPDADDQVTVMDINGNVTHYESVADAVEHISDLSEGANGCEISLVGNSQITSDLTVAGTRNLFFDLGGRNLSLAEGKKIALQNVNVMFLGSGSLEGFDAENIELDDMSVLTLPKSASALAEALEAKGKYVTKNADESWSVANTFDLRIQVVDGQPCLGFLEDTRRSYTVEASTDLTVWAPVDASVSADTAVSIDDPALPLKWKAPESGQFFKVRATGK